VRGGGCGRGSGLLPVRAPIAGQPPVVVDTVVADMVVGAVSDPNAPAVTPSTNSSGSATKSP
jgi:hypothetical protein